MIDRQYWEDNLETVLNGYLHREDGCYTDMLKGNLIGHSYEEQSISIEFNTQPWQVNERGTVIHGGVIAGMFDTVLGMVANFVAGKNEAATMEASISYMRPLKPGEHAIVKAYIVKAGRALIRLRAEMYSKESGKLLATEFGTWVPL